MMHVDARIATAWLVGYSQARLGKPDDSATRYRGTPDESELIAGYQRGRLAGERSLSANLAQAA